MENLLRQLVKLSAKLYYKVVYSKKSDKKYIPASGKLLDEKDLLNMIDASLDMWLTAGRFCSEFEKKFAQFLNVKHALCVNSGSSANLIAISALMSSKLGEKRLKKGDEVITVAASFPTTLNPIIQNGLIPVFVDCELESYNIDSAKIEKSITNKTKAIFLAHTLGNPFDLKQVLKICEKHNLWLIEDSCDALGAKYEDKFTGTIGHIGTFSFYPAHHITMGEGGAVVTNDSAINKILLSYRDWGRDCACPPGKDGVCGKRFSMQLGNLPFGYDHKYTYSHLGYNLKITDWQGALGLSQLEKLPFFIEKRVSNAKYLLNKLSDLKEYFILPDVRCEAYSSWFGFLISVKAGAKFTKQELIEFLEENGIGTRQLFAGNILRQPMIIDNEIDFRIEDSELINSKNIEEKHYKLLPNTDFIMNNTFWVGVFPALTEKDLDKISKKIHEFVQRF